MEVKGIAINGSPSLLKLSYKGYTQKFLGLGMEGISLGGAGEIFFPLLPDPPFPYTLVTQLYIPSQKENQKWLRNP